MLLESHVHEPDATAGLLKVPLPPLPTTQNKCDVSTLLNKNIYVLKVPVEEGVGGRGGVKPLTPLFVSWLKQTQ